MHSTPKEQPNVFVENYLKNLTLYADEFSKTLSLTNNDFLKNLSEREMFMALYLNFLDFMHKKLERSSNVQFAN